jgi:hypothetical protein
MDKSKINYQLYLSGLLTEQQYIEAEHDVKHYMFFNNLKTIKEKVDNLLKMDHKKIDSMLADGHDWANDHIATSKDDVEEVYNWIMSNIKEDHDN